MNKWAILSGIEGNLAAYEAVMADINRQDNVEALYILGDLVGPRPDAEKLVERIQNPKRGELEPLVCKGWWEEQCLILHGLGATGEATELITKYGGDTVKKLWDSVSRQTVQWLRSLDFGFFELDCCLLIHGSTVGVDDELTPDTSPIQMLDRLSRMQANNLFCGRSGLTFQYQLQTGSMTTSLTTLDNQASPQKITISPRQVIGVGNVGRNPKQATYTLYNPSTNQVEFKTVYYGNNKAR